jgi:hypothetical protein
VVAVEAGIGTSNVVDVSTAAVALVAVAVVAVEAGIGTSNVVDVSTAAVALVAAVVVAVEAGIGTSNVVDVSTAAVAVALVAVAVAVAVLKPKLSNAPWFDDKPDDMLCEEETHGSVGTVVRGTYFQEAESTGAKSLWAWK